MKKKYGWEILFLVLAVAVSLIGFSNLFVGGAHEVSAYHLAHIVTSLDWLVLLLVQLVLIRGGDSRRHRAIVPSASGSSSPGPCSWRL
jgi:hypothetical protein